MESGVEHAHLRNLGKQRGDSSHTLEVGGVVQGSQVVASLESCQHLLIEENRLAELLTAMHHTVTYSVELVERLQCAILGTGECLQDKLHTSGVLLDVFFEYYLLAIGQGQLKERAGKANLLDTALGEYRLGVHLEEFVLDG